MAIVGIYPLLDIAIWPINLFFLSIYVFMLQVYKLFWRGLAAIQSA